MITVKDLIEELKNMPQDAIVIVQQDAEGNGYRKCVGADSDAYTYNLDDYCLEVQTYDDIIDYDDELRSTQVVVIYPE